MLLATVAILAITLLFVDFTGIAARWLSFLPKIQLVPALLALNLGALCLLAVRSVKITHHPRWTLDLIRLRVGGCGGSRRRHQEPVSLVITKDGRI